MRSVGKIFILLVAAALLSFSGCKNGENGGAILDVAAEVETEDSGTQVAVVIFEGINPVMDATVTVNGENVPHLFLGIYTNTITTVSAGQTATLDIQRSGSTINASLTMPQRPTVTEPTSGTYDASNALLVQWGSVSPTPDSIGVIVDKSNTVSGVDYEVFLSGSSNSHSIPGNTLKTSISGITVQVGSVNSTTSLGSFAAAGSTFLVVNVDDSDSFSTQ